MQRFGGALNLNVHLHSLILDGVFVRDPAGGRPRFRPVAAPSPEDLDRVLRRTRERIQRLLADRGHAVGSPSSDASQDEPALFDVVQAASIREWKTMGERSGPAEVLGRRDLAREWIEKPFSAEGEGYSLHAGVRIRKGDRAGLEKLCRYLLRPPFASDRLDLLPDGRVQYRFRQPRPDGSTHVVLEPLDFLARLAALVPPPRSHLVRYHGVLGPHHAQRSRVVPKTSRPRRKRRCDEAEPELGALVKKRRTAWATLMRRTMGLDPLACPRCGGRLDFEACVEDADEIRAWLREAGEPEDPPPLSPARPPPQSSFEFDQAG